ncbi:MAG: hypothetical protein AWM53_01405 [Candidatus Dichloromethanomonas elyunquensis]|nr:MAG: hypothetical protein AWM53_01405 [Candidatus Dichloromethanomonas elyunquensis]
MGITMEQIDEIRKRTNCSYQEAKELLDQHDGDLIEAVIAFEKKHGHKSKHHSYSSDKNHRLGKKVKELLQKGFVTRLIIEKEESTVLNVPVNILLLVMFITMPVFWLYIILSITIYLMGYKIRIKKEEGEEVNINDIVDGIGSKVRTAAEQMREKPGEKEGNNPKNNSKDTGKKDDYNEVTVE